MDNQIKYTVTVQDLISGKLGGMDAQAKKLEGTLAGIGNAGTSMGKKIMSGMAMLGIGFSAFKGIELMKEGVEAVEKLHQAQAQVKVGLESTGNAAGVTTKSLDEMAKKFSSASKYSRTDITELQSLMLTFPAITKETFPQATQAIMDMSTRLGQDTKSSAIQLGKALQDPVKGISALHRVGVNFSEGQKNMIKNFVATGQAAKAQQMILAELNTEFGGSAKAAFDADPLAKYNKMMVTMKMAMGEAGLAILEALQPALLQLGEGVKWVAEKIKDAVHWLQAHSEAVKTILVIISPLLVMYGLYVGYLKAQVMWTKAVAAATAIQTAAQWALNVAMDANPIGLIIVGVAALIGLIYEVVKHFDSWGAALTILMGPIGILISAIMSIKRHWESIVDAFKGDGIIGGLKRIGIVLLDTLLYPLQKALELASKIPGLGKLAGDGAKAIQEMRKSMNLITPEESEKKGGVATTKGKSAFKAINTPTGGDASGSKKPSGVKGQNITTITIHIDSLVKSFSVNTTNLNESSDLIQEKVAMALTAAVNDSQIIK